MMGPANLPRFRGGRFITGPKLIAGITGYSGHNLDSPYNREERGRGDDWQLRPYSRSDPPPRILKDKNDVRGVYGAVVSQVAPVLA